MSCVFPAPSRTPLALGHRNPLQITYDHQEHPPKDDGEHGLTVWHEQYPFGK